LPSLFDQRFLVFLLPSILALDWWCERAQQQASDTVPILHWQVLRSCLCCFGLAGLAECVSHMLGQGSPASYAAECNSLLGRLRVGFTETQVGAGAEAGATRIACVAETFLSLCEFRSLTVQFSM
jgi:hypothetical protein